MILQDIVSILYIYILVCIYIVMVFSSLWAWMSIQQRCEMNKMKTKIRHKHEHTRISEKTLNPILQDAALFQDPACKQQIKTCTWCDINT